MSFFYALFSPAAIRALCALGRGDGVLELHNHEFGPGAKGCYLVWVLIFMFTNFKMKLETRTQ